MQQRRQAKRRRGAERGLLRLSATQTGVHRIAAERAAEHVPLTHVATEPEQRLGLRRILDAFGYALEVERRGEPDHCFDECRAGGFVAEPLDERLGDLEAIDR